MRSPRTVNVSAAWLGVAVVVCSAACGASDGRVVAPMPTGPTVVFPPSFPAVLRPARVYDARGAVSYPLSAWTLGSRYVLYEDGAFALRFLSGREYRGTYQQQNGAVTFQWEDSNINGPWGAAGSLTGESLTVRYDFIMQYSDFEDAIYNRTQ